MIIEATPGSLDLVARFYEPLNDRLRADLDGFDAEQLGRLAGFGRAAERSTEAEIRRL